MLFSRQSAIHVYFSGSRQHCLRVYDAVTGAIVAEYLIELGPVVSLAWAPFNTSVDQASPDAPPSRKKRKKREGPPAKDAPRESAHVVVLGLSDGTVLLFSASHGRVVRTLSHPQSTSSVLAVECASDGMLWTSCTDGVVRVWDIQKSEVVSSWKTADRIPYSCLAARPVSSESEGDMLAASHSIHLLSPPDNTPRHRFLSAAERDRVICLWALPAQTSGEGAMVASAPLDNDVRSLAMSLSSSIFLSVDAAGKVSVFPIPQDLSAATKKSGRSIPTLLPQCIVSPPSVSSPVVSAAFIGQGEIRIARLVGGVRPVFESIRYMNESGKYQSIVKLDEVRTGLVSDTPGKQIAPAKRYAEASAVQSGFEIAHDQDMDENVADGELDVDLAELSLGQRLTALTGTEVVPASDSDDAQDQPMQKSKSATHRKQADLDIVPANSLTRTLIQALHSSDSRLLETCLAHSNATLIRNSVRRLPPQLVVPLLNACVERLGRGARAANMRGGGGGASSQRGTGLITWIKTVVAVHSGHLLTVPDLVARLAGLHATLMVQLALQESLLSLNGRLEMVLAQVEMCTSAALATLLPQKAFREMKHTEVTYCVGGESGDEDVQMDVEVERPGVKSTVIDPETKELWPGYYMRHFRVSEGPLETIWNDHGECEFALNRGADPKCIVTHNGENIDTYPIIWERLFYRNEFEAVAGSVLQRMVHNFRGYDLVSDEGIERAIEDMTTILVSLDPLITRFEPSGRRNTDETQQDSEGGNLIDESKPE
ncbi:WD40 repeat-like protein [Fistulina hepatica ATCC 64428]|uniref:WD40 repeat-like protein n=1 Tax=Fistulina hepatica ATCC 64428 TaxID=1128425 RepID=A0A0D7A5Q6_9AGAR|nr:WD40 repeat-like protein [Fistulina hepatica ATCC 64428]